MSDPKGNPGSAFFGSFPTRGIWTALGLSRVQFFVILALSVSAFLFIDGALWEHLEANHFRRIVVSYAAIPLMILAAQLQRRRFSWATLFGGSITIGALKLLITALVVLFSSL